MEKLVQRFSPHAFAVLRILAGLLFALHGSFKLFQYLPLDIAPLPFNALMISAGIIEIVTGLMIAFGLLAGIAAFIASGEIAVAYFMVHAPQGFLPTQNGGEKAVLYCFLFLYVALRGSGASSVYPLVKTKS